MFRPQIQKTRVLAVLACLSLLMVYISSQSRVIDVAPGYQEKINAAKIMESNKIFTLVVFDSKKAIGVISMHDLLQSGIV